MVQGSYLFRLIYKPQHLFDCLLKIVHFRIKHGHIGFLLFAFFTEGRFRDPQVRLFRFGVFDIEEERAAAGGDPGGKQTWRKFHIFKFLISH